jgi:hypothetical protein
MNRLTDHSRIGVFLFSILALAACCCLACSGLAVADTIPGKATVSVIVKLEDQPLATYEGGIQGLAATSIESTGGSRLDVDSHASRVYLAYLEKKIDTLQVTRWRPLGLAVAPRVNSLPLWTVLRWRVPTLRAWRLY